MQCGHVYFRLDDFGRVLVPVDKTKALTEAEIAWWDDYHAEVRRILAPRLEGADLAWLERETRPL